MTKAEATYQANKFVRYVDRGGCGDVWGKSKSFSRREVNMVMSEAMNIVVRSCCVFELKKGDYGWEKWYGDRRNG